MTGEIEVLEAGVNSAISPHQKIDALNVLAWTIKEHPLQRSPKLSREAHQQIITTDYIKGKRYKKALVQSLRNLVPYQLNSCTLGKKIFPQRRRDAEF